MLSLTDCLDFIDLDGDTIDVIAQHQNLPAMVAAQLGSELLAERRGIRVLHLMHCDLIDQAARRGLRQQAKHLQRVYAAFARKYPLPPEG